MTSMTKRPTYRLTFYSYLFLLLLVLLFVRLRLLLLSVANHHGTKQGNVHAQQHKSAEESVSRCIFAQRGRSG